jgi:hypothetical protein
VAFDLITGKRGTGKSKLAVILLREHMLKGKLVATNLDLTLEKLLPPRSRAFAIRVPDKPTAIDLAAIGDGNNGNAYEEDDNGLLVLDELSTWLNARTFQDKERAPVIDWLVHSRKHGWECAFITQDLVQIDKQVRESLVEYVIRCLRMDKMRIPLVGWIIAALIGEGRAQLPKVHLAVRRLGCDPKGLKARDWWYRDAGVQQGYDTRQVFRMDYPHGSHCLLSPWHTVGRFMPPDPTWRQRIEQAIGKLFGPVSTAPKTAPAARRHPHPLVARIAATLPPDEALRHVARLTRRGFI